MSIPEIASPLAFIDSLIFVPIFPNFIRTDRF
jgi:hypothetical protein